MNQADVVVDARVRLVEQLGLFPRQQRHGGLALREVDPGEVAVGGHVLRVHHENALDFLHRGLVDSSLQVGFYQVVSDGDVVRRLYQKGSVVFGCFVRLSVFCEQGPQVEEGGLVGGLRLQRGLVVALRRLNISNAFAGPTCVETNARVVWLLVRCDGERLERSCVVHLSLLVRGLEQLDARPESIVRCHELIDGCRTPALGASGAHKEEGDQREGESVDSHD